MNKTWWPCERTFITSPMSDMVFIRYLRVALKNQKKNEIFFRRKWQVEEISDKPKTTPNEKNCTFLKRIKLF